MGRNQTDHADERKFHIEVENQFDFERRPIQIVHRKSDGTEITHDIVFRKKTKGQTAKLSEQSIDEWIAHLLDKCESKKNLLEAKAEQLPGKLIMELPVELIENLLEQSKEQSFTKLIEKLVNRLREKSKNLPENLSEQLMKKLLPFPRKTFRLSTGDFLEITIGGPKEPGQNTKHWYIKLPYMADFIFPWGGKPDKKPEVKQMFPALPILHCGIARDVHTGGRTVLYFDKSIDSGGLKLLIAPPGRIEENYHPKHLKEGFKTENDGRGTPDDNVAVGDNNVPVGEGPSG